VALKTNEEAVVGGGSRGREKGGGEGRPSGGGEGGGEKEKMRGGWRGVGR